MTVPTEVSRVEYVGNGATVAFPVPFGFVLDDDLVVKTILISTGAQTTLVLGVDYTVAGAGGGSGVVTATAAPSNLNTLRIERTIPIVQDQALSTQGPMTAAALEAAYDYAIKVCQELLRRIEDLEDNSTSNSAIAGAGLAVSGSTWNVGVGAGLQAFAHIVAVAYDDAGPASVDMVAAVDGDSDSPARQNHTHQVLVAAPSALVAGGGAVAGIGPQLAAKDHIHAAPVGAPVDLNSAAPVTGATGNFSDAGHKHKITTAAPVTLGTGNSIGAATSLAPSDHVHDHGAQALGTHHAVATTVVAGFMSAVDKTKLDGLAAEVIITGAVHTADATPTTGLSFTPADESVEMVEVTIAMIKDTGGSGGAWKISGGFRRNDGATVQIAGTSAGLAVEDDAGAPSVAFAVASPAVNVVVTGVAATNFGWAISARRLRTP